jgi:hypothetical protein
MTQVTTAAAAAAAGEQPVMQDAVQQQEHQSMNQHDRCTQEQMLQMMQEYDCWVFDCDGEHVPGTFWPGQAIATMWQLTASGKSIKSCS